MDITQGAQELLTQDLQIAERLTDAAWERLGGAELGILDRTEVASAIAACTRSLLLAVAEDRRPNESELEPVRRIAERRAVQGVPIETMISSWRNAERTMLSRLLISPTPPTTVDIQEVVRRVGVVVDAMLGAATTAYRGVAGELHPPFSHVSVDLVSRLAGAQALDPAHLDRLASTAGVRVHQPHRVIALSVGPQDGPQVGRARQALVGRLRSHVDGPILLGGHQGCTILVVADVDRIDEVLERALGDAGVPASAAVGLGTRRARFNEAAGSLREAVAALEVGRRLGERLTRFEQVVPEVLIVENRSMAAQMSASVLGPIDKGDLLETLRTFLRCGLSTRATAGELQVHENTVTYRIRRICELLGVASSAELARVDILMALRARQLYDDLDVLRA
ncbi:helix-turn-helix domain-containing protein [Nocardioides carbamazepini]|uniref:PucR family transcriptional regulator n=1 Tax=Nocardioides carbamazepini TaxID=2854259 RepID=UPI00214A5A82|nr:helix-turn-helix domain-containing protein [Nocardioides carbamazepini]MCR1784972.1 helix-turn-helix domain-containing protein [Nocardioides carbamazepini]